MTLTLLQWNIWYKEDISKVAKFLRDHPADIICLQELTAPDHIAKKLGYQYFYKEIDLGKGKINIANGIFSRYPIVATHWRWINQATGSRHYDDEDRAYIEATVDINGRHITIATTHMSYTDAFVGSLRKQQETERLVEELKSKKRGFIFTGDLNAPPDSPTVQAVNGILQNAGPDFNKNTWTTKPFFCDGFKETELRWRLDYIFVTSDITTKKVTVLQTELSDHLPVWAELELASPTSGSPAS